MSIIYKTPFFEKIEISDLAKKTIEDFEKSKNIEARKSMRQLPHNFYEYTRYNSKFLIYRYKLENINEPIYIFCDYTTDFESGWHKIEKKVENNEYKISNEIIEEIIEYFETKKLNYLENEEVIEIIFEAYILLNKFKKALEINRLSKFKNNRNWSKIIKFDKFRNAGFVSDLFDFVLSTSSFELLNIELFKHLKLVFETDTELFKILKNKKEIQNDLIKELIVKTFRLISYSDIEFEEFKEIDANKTIFSLTERVVDFYKNAKEINYFEFASTIERTIEKSVIILEIYESILKENRDEEKQKFIEKRWLKVKSRREKFYTKQEENKTKNINENVFEDSKIIDGVFKEYESRFSALKIKCYFKKSEINEISAYPQIKELIKINKTRKFTAEQEQIIEINDKLFTYLINKYQEQNFYFKLRNSEQKTKIEDGYLFNGDENVSVSFWEGTQNNKPIIEFIVWKDKTSSVVLNAGSSEQLIDLFENIAIFFDDFKRKKEKGQEITEWLLDYKDADYLKNLTDFIENKKNKIDNLITKKLNHKLKDLDGLLFIDKIMFKENLDNILKIRNISLTTINIEEKNDYIVLNSIELHNIGRFKEPLKIDFDNNLTCIIGENGLGKTTILSAIPLAILGVNNNSIISEYQNYLIKKLRIEKTEETEIFAGTGYIQVDYTIGNDKFNNRIEFIDSGINGIKIKDVSSSDFKATFGTNNLLIKNLILGFPQGGGRIDFKSNEQIKNLLSLKEANISDIFALIFSFDDDRIPSFKSWLSEVETDWKNGNEKAKQTIDIIFEIISEITDKNISLKFIDRPKNGELRIILKTNENLEGISSEMLSQGLSNVFNWIGYFIQRLYETNPDVRDIKNAHGILLIDEIDIYLHPKWQVKLLKVLRKEFSNIQFIVSTHSPLIVHGLDKNQICKLYVTDNNIIKSETNSVDIWSWSYLNILEELYNQIDPEPTKTEKELIELINKAEQNKEIQNITSYNETLKRLQESQLYKNEIEQLKQNLKQHEVELKKLKQEYKDKLLKLK